MNPFHENPNGWAYKMWQEGYEADLLVDNPYEPYTFGWETFNSGRCRKQYETNIIKAKGSFP